MRSTRNPALAATLLTAAMLLVACSGGSDEAEPPPATRETIAPRVTAAEPELVPADSAPQVESEPDSTVPPVPLDYAIEFEDLGAGVDGGWLTVPVDYADPQGATLDLWVTRHRTTQTDDRIGILFTNNGGPGVPASSMAASVRGWLMDPLVERFDVVSWDPRGTGVSGGSVDCIEDSEYDTYFGSSDITPETDEERQALVDLAQDFAAACEAQDGQLLPFIGTNNSARDMDAIRQALGEDQASFLGYSYGSELGAVWATLFPDTVRAAVLDGAAHPDSEGLEPVKQQQVGFEQVFNGFLAQCSAEPTCPFHNDGDAEGAFDRLLADLDENPVPGPEGRPLVGQEIAIGGAVQAMYSDRRWPALERALDDAANGDGSGLLALHDSYFQRDPDDGSYTDLLESFQAITCADDPERLTPEESDEREAELIGIAPRLFPYTTGSYTCDFFPASADPRAAITGERAGPIVVIGTTGDPSTPLTSSAAMAEALDEGTLVTVEANQHTAYRSGDCINDLVHQYLIWLEVPAPDARCAS
ncbi:MAG: alpha/beta fold hydrolase [Ilumatobacter sp.]|uniref:alpha/beta hydrolase n=1 Tax=Ilumatobacter sp. TaxID=1967498 RepID=UPI0032986180